MATLREFFAGEFNCMKSDTEITFSTQGRVVAVLTARVYYEFDAFVRFVSYYVPAEYASLEALSVAVSQHEDALRLTAGSIEVSIRHPVFDPYGAAGSELPFTGRIILYVEAALDDQLKSDLWTLANSLGLHLQIRDREYEALQNSTERPMGFFSHDSRDKKTVVGPVADKLRSMLCPVWYDEYSLVPGKSLRESIDQGLRESKKCVVVLSPNFLTNPGWTKAEFNAAVNRHFSSGGNVLVPIWHQVSRQEVYDYSPLVADIYALNSSVGVEELTNRLHRVLMAPDPA